MSTAPFSLELKAGFFSQFTFFALIKDISGGCLQQVGHEGQLQPLPLRSVPAARAAVGSVQAELGSCLQGEGHRGTSDSVSAPGHCPRHRKWEAECTSTLRHSLGNVGRGEAFPAQASGWVQDV